MLTVVTFLWRGWRPVYNASHVNALQRMLLEYLRMPHRLVCITDMPDGIKCETLPLWSWPNVHTAPRQPNCYRRLKLFDPAMRVVLGDRILSIDLDCVAFYDLTLLITHHDFRIVKGYTALYNGSMWLHTTGTRPQVYRDFTQRVAGELNAAGKGSDQAWLSAKLPGEATWTGDDGVRMFFEATILKRSYSTTPRILFFPGPTKPWHARVAREYPEIYRQYMKFYEPTNGTCK